MENLIEIIKNSDVLEKSPEGLKESLKLIGIGALTYVFSFSEFNHIGKLLDVGALSESYSLSVGSGFYGGISKWENKNLLSIAGFLGAFSPEIYMFVAGEDLKKIVTSGAIKAFGYGFGRLFGSSMRRVLY